MFTALEVLDLLMPYSPDEADAIITDSPSLKSVAFDALCMRVPKVKTEFVSCRTSPAQIVTSIAFATKVFKAQVTVTRDAFAIQVPITPPHVRVKGCLSFTHQHALRL